MTMPSKQTEAKETQSQHPKPYRAAAQTHFGGIVLLSPAASCPATAQFEPVGSILASFVLPSPVIRLGARWTKPAPHARTAARGREAAGCIPLPGCAFALREDTAGRLSPRHPPMWGTRLDLGGDSPPSRPFPSLPMLAGWAGQQTRATRHVLMWFVGIQPSNSSVKGIHLLGLEGKK